LENPIVGIEDGVTLALLACGNIRHKIRLQAFDAAELGQVSEMCRPSLRGCGRRLQMAYSPSIPAGSQPV